MMKMTYKEVHNIMQYVMKKARCEIICYIGKYVCIKHIDSNKYGMLLSIDANGSWKVPSLENHCYNPARRECMLLEWMTSESSLGKMIIAHLDDSKFHIILEKNVFKVIN